MMGELVLIAELIYNNVIMIHYNSPKSKKIVAEQ